MIYNWNSQENKIFLNPKIENAIKENIINAINKFDFKSHVFLATSGSSSSVDSSQTKIVALSNEAILNSSASVNEHLAINSKDIFLNSLPHFHIGGPSVFSRAYLANAKVIDIYSENYKWNPLEFVTILEQSKVSVTSLVPTQIYDLVFHQIKAPKFLRIVIVGGGAIAYSLYSQAKALGWCLLPCYGMTESASQIASVDLDFIWKTDTNLPLRILKHINVQIDNDSRISLSGSSLLTGYITISNQKVEFIDPKSSTGIFTTTDLGSIKHPFLEIIGRSDDVLKINGELVSLTKLDSILEDVKSKLAVTYDLAIVALADSRKGHSIYLVTTKKEESTNTAIQQAFNKIVLAYERIQNIFVLKEIPRTELSKLRRKLLVEILNKNINGEE